MNPIELAYAKVPLVSSLLPPLDFAVIRLPRDRIHVQTWITSVQNVSCRGRCSLRPLAVQ